MSWLKVQPLMSGGKRPGKFSVARPTGTGMFRASTLKTRIFGLRMFGAKTTETAETCPPAVNLSSQTGVLLT